MGKLVKCVATGFLMLTMSISKAFLKCCLREISELHISAISYARTKKKVPREVPEVALTLVAERACCTGSVPTCRIPHRVAVIYVSKYKGSRAGGDVL